MRNTVQKTIWEVFGLEGEDNNNSTEGVSEEARGAEDTSEAAIVRGYREANLKRMSREEKLEWLAGYIDGDGNIFVTRRYDYRYDCEWWGRYLGVYSTDKSLIDVTQSLMKEMHMYGRVFTEDGRENVKVVDRIVSKTKRKWIYMMQDEASLRTFVRNFTRRFRTRQRVEQFNKLARSLGMVQYICERNGSVTLPWVAGFFEAEGTACVEVKRDSRNGRYYRTIRIMVSQKDDDLLRLIGKTLKEECGIDFKLYHNQCGVGMLETYGVRNATKFVNTVGKYILGDSKVCRILKVKHTIDTWNAGKERVTWTDELCEYVLSLRLKGLSYRHIRSLVRLKFGVDLSVGSIRVKVSKLMREKREEVIR